MTQVMERERFTFLKGGDYSLKIIETEDGPSAIIDEMEYPLLDTSFDLQVVQPGHVAKNKALKDVKGKIIIKIDPDDPTSDASDELLLMPICVVQEGYRYYVGEYDQGQSVQLACYSNDRLRPSPKVLAPCNERCCEISVSGYYQPVCPNAQWREKRPPKCKQILTVAFLEMLRKIPVKMSMHGTGLSAWTALMKQYKALKNVARIKGKSINDYVIRLSVDDEGTYVKPNFKLETAEDFRPLDWLPLCKYYRDHLFARPVTEPEAEVVAQTAIEESSGVSGGSETNLVDDVPF